MTSLLATDLTLLAWDDARGRPTPRAGQTLRLGIAGALLLDAVLADVIVVADDRVEVRGSSGDTLLAEIVDAATAYRRSPTVKRLVQRLGTGRLQRAAVDRLVAEGTLRTEQHRVLGLIPVTRRPVVDVGEAERLRAEVRRLLLGESDAEAADDRLVLLAALAGATSLADGLVDRRDRRAARSRAKEFGRGDGISPAVRSAVQAAEAATVAVIAAGAAASSGSN